MAMEVIQLLQTPQLVFEYWRLGTQEKSRFDLGKVGDVRYDPMVPERFILDCGFHVWRMQLVGDGANVTMTANERNNVLMGTGFYDPMCGGIMGHMAYTRHNGKEMSPAAIKKEHLEYDFQLMPGHIGTPDAAPKFPATFAAPAVPKSPLGEYLDNTPQLYIDFTKVGTTSGFKYDLKKLRPTEFEPGNQARFVYHGAFYKYNVDIFGDGCNATLQITSGADRLGGTGYFDPMVGCVAGRFYFIRFNGRDKSPAEVAAEHLEYDYEIKVGTTGNAPTPAVPKAPAGEWLDQQPRLFLTLVKQGTSKVIRVELRKQQAVQYDPAGRFTFRAEYGAGADLWNYEVTGDMSGAVKFAGHTPSNANKTDGEGTFNPATGFAGKLAYSMLSNKAISRAEAEAKKDVFDVKIVNA